MPQSHRLGHSCAQGRMLNMRKCNSSLLICTILLLFFIVIGSLQAAIDVLKQAERPDSYFAEYNVQEYHPKLPPPTPKDLERYAGILRRQFQAKDMPKDVVDQTVRNLVEEAKRPTGGPSDFIQIFGAHQGSTLYGKRNKDMPTSYIVKPDREFRYDSAMLVKEKEYPILSIRSIDPKEPPKKAQRRQEAAIFGFEPLETLFEGQPTVNKKPDGTTVLDLIVPAEKRRAVARQTITLDKEGRIISISYQGAAKDEGRWDEKWTISDYRPVGKGWVPGIITRRLHIGKELVNSLDYKLTKIETGKPVINKWFSNRVQGPTLVEDFRFNNLKVKYFTRNKLLSDKEVMRRAELQTNINRPVVKPRSLIRVFGVLLLLTGVGLLIWGLGRPKKKPKSE